MSATAARTPKACAQAGNDARGLRASPSIAAAVAMRGIRANTGMMAISWNRSTEKADCPALVRSNPCSLRL